MTIQYLKNVGTCAIDNAESHILVFFFLQILTIAVLVILLTAPIGAVAITLSGPKLLTRSARCISDVNISVSSASVAMTKPSEAEKMV